jgi:hypothetical protein
MKLTELEPRWIHPNIFVFRCPCCRKVWLSCKNVVMASFKETHDALFAGLGEGWREAVVPPKHDFAWSITGTFEDMTVSPSLDCSASGHWHGYITGGETR